MNKSSNDIEQIKSAIEDLDLDYMRGLVSEEEYNTKINELKSKLEQAGGAPSGLPTAHKTFTPPPLKPTPKGSSSKQAMTDPVTAVRKAIQDLRRISIERIAQESGVSASNTSRIIADLLDGRELSGRLDYDRGDFILGTGTGPAPKTIAVCPYCRTELKRIAVRGEIITCNVCKESFIIS